MSPATAKPEMSNEVETLWVEVSLRASLNFATRLSLPLSNEVIGSVKEKLMSFVRPWPKAIFPFDIGYARLHDCTGTNAPVDGYSFTVVNCSLVVVVLELLSLLSENFKVSVVLGEIDIRSCSVMMLFADKPSL